MSTITGYVYRIVHLQSDVQYVGSTTQEPRKRWQHHKSNFKRWLEGKTEKKLSIFGYFLQYGIENFKLLVSKQYQVCDVAHLRVYEQLLANKLRCVNKCASFVIPWLQPEQLKVYRASHREFIRERGRAQYHANREARLEYRKKYRQANREKITADQKAKTTCECGSVITRYYLPRHRKSPKHDRLLAARAAASNEAVI
jgi:hypothetical protein